MAEERKKPKIDLKTRIPSKTVKGLAPVTGSGGAIPPPPGAVVAPPPDLLGRRTIPPKISADPNDPLGAAQVEGAKPQPQQIVVVAGPEEGHAPTAKRGVLFALIGVAAVAGLGIGYVAGSASAKGTVKTKAVSDAKELSEKIAKANDNLKNFSEALKSAKSDLENKGYFDQATIDKIKGFQSGLTSNDLKGREIAYFGEETSGKLYSYFEKVGHIDDLRAEWTKGSGMERTSEFLKKLQVPKGKAKWGVTLSKPGGGKDDPPSTMASLVEFKDPADLKSAFTTDPKDKTVKLKAGTTDFDVWPGKDDFFAKSFISIVDQQDWNKACPVYPQAISYAGAKPSDLIAAIEGSGDEPGLTKTGQDLVDKLKSLAK
jgi:hypothetical protein